MRIVADLEDCRFQRFVEFDANGVFDRSLRFCHDRVCFSQRLKRPESVHRSFGVMSEKLRFKLGGVGWELRDP